jgi:hypothetical protein
MVEVVNLRRARKAHERARRLNAAAEARMRGGRTPEERAQAAEENRKAERWLAGHRLTGSAPTDGDG